MTIQFEISEYLYKCLKKRIEFHAASKLDMLVDKGTVIESKQGHWIYDDDCHEHGHCSECGTKEDLVDGKIRYFCRVCGARMSEKKEDN